MVTLNMDDQTRCIHGMLVPDLWCSYCRAKEVKELAKVMKMLEPKVPKRAPIMATPIDTSMNVLKGTRSN